MLTAEIRINGQLIGTLHCVNVTHDWEPEPVTYSLYDVIYTGVGKQFKSECLVAEGVRHVQKDGALVLMQKAIKALKK